jgi:hypothetical protein
MWKFESSTGKFFHDDQYLYPSYSGHGEGVNNPSLEQEPNVGPIPKGVWTISSAFNHSEKGPCVMDLIPQTLMQAFGRSGFMIHGDSKEHPGECFASHGCIILPRSIREQIATSGDNKLTVV